MTFELPLLIWAPVALAALALACRSAAAAIGVRLPKRALFAAAGIALASVSAYFDRERVAGPSGILLGAVPGTAAPERVDRFEPQNDLLLQLLPWELQVRKSLRARALPLWSDRLDGGSCLWCNPQAQVLSPIAIGARALPFRDFLAGTLALKVLVAFLGAWVFGATVGCRPPSRYFAGGAFALGGGMSAWALFPLASALAFAPWIAAGLIRAVRRRRRGARWAAALAVAAGLLGGHPEVATLALLFGGLSALLLRRRAARALDALRRTLVPILLGSLLAAPVLLPFARALPDSMRWRDVAAGGQRPAPAALRNPASWFLPGHVRFPAAMVVPQLFGTPYGGRFTGPFSWPETAQSYAGLCALVALATPGGPRRSRRERGLLGLGLLGLLLGWGFRPLVAALSWVPLLSAAAPNRWVPVALLSLLAAAALALDRLRRRRRVLLPALATLLLLALSARLASSREATLALLLVAAALAALKWRPALFWALWMTAAAVDLLPWAASQRPIGPARAFYPPTPFVTALARAAAAGGPFRVVGDEYEVYPNLLSVYGLEDVRPHNPLADARYLAYLGAAFDFHPDRARYFSHFRVENRAELDFLNVRFVVSRDELPPRAGLTLDLERSAPPWRVYRNDAAWPRFFATSPAGERSAEPAALRSIAEVPNGYRLVPGGVTPARIGSSLRLAPGWIARQGGAKLPLADDGRGFLQIRGPLGAQPIELRYRPPGFALGLLLAGFAAALLGIERAFDGRRRRAAAVRRATRVSCPRSSRAVPG